MKEINLTPLDEALLLKNKVVASISIPSKVLRGYIPLEVTVIKIGEDDFIVKTILYEERCDGPERHIYQGTMAERDSKLSELKCPPTDERWLD